MAQVKNNDARAYVVLVNKLPFLMQLFYFSDYFLILFENT